MVDAASLMAAAGAVAIVTDKEYALIVVQNLDVTAEPETHDST